jgi:AcrR family transcriptional regulator
VLRDLAQDPVETILSGLEAGRLDANDLSARKLCKLVGRTTSILYHHYGSLDGFLYRVAQAGFSKLEASLAKKTSLEDVAAGFVEFGLDRPCLYSVMFERKYDWERLRATGAFDRDRTGLDMWSTLVATLEALGSKAPEVDARLLYAALHGLVSLANSGRANVGALDVPDRDMAVDLARQLVRRMEQRT